MAEQQELIKEESVGGDNKPVEKFKHKGLSVDLWANKMPSGGVIKTVTMKQNYQDKKTEEWKSTNSISIEKIPELVQYLSYVYSRHFIDKP